MTLTSDLSFCSLEGCQLQDRLAWIAETNRKWLRHKRLDGRTLTLTYDNAAAGALDELLRRERQCCEALQFNLARAEAGLQLTVVAPPSAKDEGQAQLAAFGESAPGTDTTCCSTCQPPPATTAGRVAGTAAAASAVAVLACGACCVLPIAVPAIATGLSGAAVAWLADAHTWMTALAVLLVAISWIWVAWRSLKARARPASSTWVLMILATFATGAAVLWPHLESPLIRLIRQHV